MSSLLNRNHSLRALLGASLWWLVSGCQSEAFVSHEGTVRSGTSVPLSLQVSFGPGESSARTGQLVACIALPEGWQAPGGSYTHAGAAATAARPGASELSAEARAAWPVDGSTWHCLVSEDVTTTDQEVQAAAQLTLPVPAVAQGAYRVRYQSGFREVTPPDGGEQAPPYQPTDFSGRLERLLHVNVAPVTTFDDWQAGVATGILVTPSVTHAWHGNGTFLAAATGNTELLRSADGRQWTGFVPVSEGTTSPLPLERLVYSQRKWFGLSNGRIVVSSDNAFTWAPAYQDPAPEGEAEGRRFLELALSGNRMVAVGTAGLIASSTDGVSWTDESIDRAYDVVTLVPGQNSFLAVAHPMAGAPSQLPVLVRPQGAGAAWEVFQPPTLTGLTIAQLAAGNGRFLAFARPHQAPPPPLAPQAEEPASGFFLSEDLGSTWTRVETLQLPADAPSPTPLMTFVDQSFVVSWTAVDPQAVEVLPSFELQVSADGKVWTAHPTGAGGNYASTAFASGETSVVAVSQRRLLVAARRPWPLPELLTETLPPFRLGTAANVALSTRGSGTLTFELEGTLPSGLTFTPTTGTFTGTPAQSGSTAVTVRVRDARGGVAARTYSVDVVGTLSISSDALASATQGTAYEARFTVQGGRAPYTWSLGGGTVPGGLTLQQRDGAYVLSGIPTASGTFPLTVRVTDSANQTAERSVSLQVAPTPPPTEDKGDAPSGCGCSGGGAGVQALGLAALALLGRARRKR
ncbi:Ig domain-containing protein [Myxococcus sp. AM010]|uniref:Ig domain-containing protein n=1 Tax=Myxococcus sp. AM010 TaxID=2745138 RepID=UPI001595C370|nr:Ig domain-containing protein [Myxococcus sp. AM010]NVJ15649.1 putative Ig domain-containing protein [Myxococcus sp. AM010]